MRSVSMVWGGHSLTDPLRCEPVHSGASFLARLHGDRPPIDGIGANWPRPLVRLVGQPVPRSRPARLQPFLQYELRIDLWQLRPKTDSARWRLGAKVQTDRWRRRHLAVSPTASVWRSVHKAFTTPRLPLIESMKIPPSFGPSLASAATDGSPNNFAGTVRAAPWL